MKRLRVVDLVGEFYRNTTQVEARRLDRGQVCWGPGLYLPPQLLTVGLVQYEPLDERRNRYAIVPSDPNDELLFDHTPVHELHLERDEEMLVIRAKRRPMIVMSQHGQSWPPGGNRLSERGLVCLPLYSLHPNDTEEFRNRIRAQEYPWWLYLPEDSRFQMREGFLRMDRMQVVNEDFLAPRRFALTDGALWFVSEWLRYYLTEEIDPFLLEYRQEVLRSLP